MPARALAEHVSGCAGVRFRIASDGSPHDITVMAEYPAGYGFGDTARAVIAAARWPPKDDEAWRYLILNMRPGFHP
ncbi:MAG: energy transducer TonB [Acidisphaera sp.]|nr:energy transducer TonB [Acidisphaera sp.]